jgi:hypothetical protein
LSMIGILYFLAEFYKYTIKHFANLKAD